MKRKGDSAKKTVKKAIKSLPKSGFKVSVSKKQTRYSGTLVRSAQEVFDAKLNKANELISKLKVSDEMKAKLMKSPTSVHH